jgi:large subunit ribosomal protein L13
MTTKTYRLSGHAIDRKWHVLDAKGRPLGRVASEAAHLLLGKHKATYEPHLAMGDHVVIVNASEVALTGRKAETKVYYRHSGHPGGLKERSFSVQMQRDPRRVVERAVWGMLPGNARGRELFRHLKVYAGSEHPHEAQVNAGTGARARKRQNAATREQAARAAAPAAAAAAVAVAAAGQRLTGSLERHKRDELDAEAARLGIEIQKSWKKGDVAAAIQSHYDAHPED